MDAECRNAGALRFRHSSPQATTAIQPGNGPSTIQTFGQHQKINIAASDDLNVDLTAPERSR
jgi:hypothetical protein